MKKKGRLHSYSKKTSGGDEPLYPTLRDQKNTQVHHHHTHKLLYIVTFLLIILILTIVFSYPLYVDQPTQLQEVVSSLVITSATCTWQDTKYEICETLSWDGQDGTYAKPYIPGGDLPENVLPHYEKQFTYCQTVGSEEGYRVVRAMLFDEQGIVKDIGLGVSCEDKPRPVVRPVSRQTTYKHTVKGQILAQQAITSRRTYAKGTYTLQFPDNVQSCTITGTWETDNDPWGRTRRFCHKATGSFTSYVDATQQYVDNDPNAFNWAGEAKSLNNPPVTRYDGYALYMHTCTHLYYRNPAYYARSTVTGFGTPVLTFNWEYFDDETQPQVYFTFEAECTLKPSS